MKLPSISEYNDSIRTPQLVKPGVLSGGHPIEKGNTIIKYSGGFCVVYPYQTSAKKYAVRCWHADVSDAKHRTQIISKALNNAKLPYFVGFEYYDDGIATAKGVQPIVVMDWVDAKPLKKYIEEHLSDGNCLRRLAESFRTMVADLHRHSMAHGDLQHGNILVRDDGSIVLVDYDSMYVPELKGMSDEIKGLHGYQHEARWSNQYTSEKIDYFSELVIYISLIALSKQPSLWEKLNIADTETLIFNADDIKSKGSTAIFYDLRLIDGLTPLLDKLESFLEKDSIDDLEPLEQAAKSLKEQIVGKWGNYTPPITVIVPPHIDDPDKIAKAFGNNGYNPQKVDSKTKEQNASIAKSIADKIKNHAD